MNRVSKLRRRLSYVFDKTNISINLGEFAWVGETNSTTAWVNDEIASGRASMRAARRFAENGMAALEDGDEDLADTMAWEALTSYAGAIACQVRPEGWRAFEKPAKRRGRTIGAKTGTKKISD